jgi:dienelactone hydrolase
MSRRVPTAALAALLAISVGCNRPASPTAPTQTPAPTPAPAPGPAAAAQLAIVGDPESQDGATWTLRGPVDGAVVDLHGVLMKPPGAGPFPAVVISHGYGGSAGQFAAGVGRAMRGWGLVVIGTDYTHAAGGPTGVPGGANDLGASEANVLRAYATLSVLGRLGYVDVRRVAAHGHSLGAFVTTAFAAAHGDRLRVASHTAGGVRPDGIPVAAAPGVAQAGLIRTPYQWHHGSDDDVVPLALDQLFEVALDASGVAHEGHVYTGATHDISQLPEVLDRIRSWYAAHGMF